MGDAPVPLSHAGGVSGALLEAAAEAVEDTSGKAPAYKGVRKRRNTFNAFIWNGGKTDSIGYYVMAEEAARAYDARARSLGHKAVNFPDAKAGEVKAVKGVVCKTTLKRAAGSAAKTARTKRAAPAAGAAAAPSPAAPPLAKQSLKAPGAKAAPQPPPLFRGPPSALPQQMPPPPPPPLPPPPPPPQQRSAQQQLQPQPQQPTLLPPPAPPPAQQLSAGHAAPLLLPGASPEEAFIASLSLADPADVLGRMRAADISLPDLLHATRPCGSKEARQQAWSDLCDDIGVTSGGERARMRATLARLQ